MKTHNAEKIHRLAGENLDLAYKLAIDAHKSRPWIEKDDLISDALLGLVNAARHFDESRGVKFVTYAYHTIARQLYRTGARGWRNVILAGDSVDRFDNVNPWDTAFVEPFDPETLDHAGELEQAKALLASLPARERGVIRKCFGIDSEKQTLCAIGKTLGVTKERVRQIKEKALTRMRKDAGGAA